MSQKPPDWEEVRAEGNTPDTQTMHDGETTVTMNKPSVEFRNQHFNAIKKDKGYYPPCINPSCKSYGKSHPNCLCYSPGGEAEQIEKRLMAHGGAVHYCSSDRPHHKDCEYFAEGGVAQELPQTSDNPSETIGHAAVSQGLLGLLRDIGKAAIKSPEKHEKVLHDARDQYKNRKERNGIDLPASFGTRLGNKIANSDIEGAAEHIKDHPLVGSISHKKLAPIMEKMADPMVHSDPHPEAFRAGVDYLHSAMKGRDALDAYMPSMLGSKPSEPIEPDKEKREELKKHLDNLKLNPESHLETGGSLGHYLPNHSAHLGALSSTAASYLDTLKPIKSQGAPLDDVSPVDKTELHKYERQLDIANNPMLVLQHVKYGTLLPADMQTIEVLYPGLHKALVAKATEAIMDAKEKDTEIPYVQKQGLSMLLGQPMDSTMTPQSMQAIIAANGSPQDQQGQKNSKATGPELKAIEKADDMGQTDLQKRQINKKQ